MQQDRGRVDFAALLIAEVLDRGGEIQAVPVVVLEDSNLVAPNDERAILVANGQLTVLGAIASRWNECLFLLFGFVLVILGLVFLLLIRVVLFFFFFFFVAACRVQSKGKKKTMLVTRLSFWYRCHLMYMCLLYWEEESASFISTSSWYVLIMYFWSTS